MDHNVSETVQSHHVRSVSLPSSVHPSLSEFNEDLHKLRNTFVRLPASSQTICISLKRLCDLYNSLENLPNFHQHTSLVPNQMNWLEDELDVSLALLDICGELRDLVSTIRELIQVLQNGFRRKRQAEITSQANAYFVALEKAQKGMKKCLRLSKQVYCSGFCAEAREQTVVVLQHVLSFCMSRSKLRAIIPRAMRNRKVACGEEQNEISSFDALFELISGKHFDDDVLLKGEKQVERVELCAKGFESGLECLLKRLIQNRVWLLNIMSHQ